MTDQQKPEVLASHRGYEIHFVRFMIAASLNATIFAITEIHPPIENNANDSIRGTGTDETTARANSVDKAKRYIDVHLDDRAP